MHRNTHSPLAGWDTADTAVWPIFGWSGAGPRAPLNPRDHRLVSPRKSPPPKCAHLREDGSRPWWPSRWKLHWLTGSLLRRKFPSHRQLLHLLLQQLKNASHSSAQIRGAAGVKGWGAPTRPTVYPRRDARSLMDSEGLPQREGLNPRKHAHEPLSAECWTPDIVLEVWVCCNKKYTKLPPASPPPPPPAQCPEHVQMSHVRTQEWNSQSLRVSDVSNNKTTDTKELKTSFGELSSIYTVYDWQCSMTIGPE